MKLNILVLALLFAATGSFAQNVTVTGADAATNAASPFATLGAAFTSVNASAQTGNTITITIAGNTTETASAVLNQSSGPWASLSIQPGGGAARTISGNLAAPLIDLNGADNVTINGLNTGGNSLILDNQNTGNLTTNTLRFIDDATNNTIQNCSILGASTSVTLGTVIFSSGVASGNSNNTISNCTIAGSGASLAVNNIYAAGTAGFENANNTIQNCNIADYFSATVSSAGIALAANNTGWVITGNKFYQSASRTSSAFSVVYRAIQIAGGSGYTITNNKIGFATATGTGIYTITSSVLNSQSRFVVIDLAVSTVAASSVQGNIISAISLNSGNSVFPEGMLCGINITSGNVNVGNITGNTFGGASGIDSIKVTRTQGNGSGRLVGIHSSSTGTILIQGNTIGGLTITNTVASGNSLLNGINVTGAATSMTITGNTIGNSTPDNMITGTNGFTTGANQFFGINISAAVLSLTVNNNIIQNFLGNTTVTGGGTIRGIFQTANVTGASIYGNSIHDLKNGGTYSGYTFGGNTPGQISLAGIIISSGTNTAVTNNSIYNLSTTNTGTGNFVVGGISVGGATNTMVSGNHIYGLSNAGTGTVATAPPVVCGVLIYSGATAGTPVTVANNMISLGSGQTTNTSYIGIFANHEGATNPVDRIYHNTVTIEGTAAAGALSSFCFNRGDLTATARTPDVDIRNNIFTNNRTGGTGQHFAIADNFGSTSTATGWPANASDNNILNANAATVGYWNAALSFGNWATAAASDAASSSGVAVNYVNPAFNLHLTPFANCTITGPYKGATLAAVTTDFDGSSRNTIPFKGAHEALEPATVITGIFNTAPGSASRTINISGATDFLLNCELIANVVPNGASPISGVTTAKVWIEGTQPASYVKRHYEITPATGAGTATGRVTLYFTQIEFDDYNAVNSGKLPTGPGDAAGIGRLRIEKYPGSSSNGSGLPGTYTGPPSVIDPADADIIWNATAGRWEVTFNVTGFSGFFVKTFSSLAGDYYRSTTSGNWNSPTTWESSSSSNFSTNFVSPATLAPDQNAAGIHIRNGNTVTVTANVTTDKTFVNPGGTLAVNAAVLTVINNGLTIQSSAAGTGRIGTSTGTISGSVIVERWIKLRAGGTGRAYRLLAPTVNTTASINANWMEGGMNTAIGSNVNPLALHGTQITGAGGNANGFDVTASNVPSLYSAANGVTPTYTAIGSTSASLNALTGYFLYIRGDRNQNMTMPLAAGMPTSSTTLRTTGTLLQGPQTSFTNAFMGGGALNLVTNPYASPIDWSLVQPACSGITGSYTYWDANIGTRGGFATVTTGGVSTPATSATQFIQSGQAFFVESNGSVPTVSIQESHKAVGNNNDVFLVPLPPVESFRTELYFTEPNGFRRVADGAIAVYDNTYSNNIDANDAKEINNWDENIAINRNGKHLAIEARPVIGKSDDLPIFMNNMKQQAYEFEFTPLVFTNTNLKAELIDNFLGTRTLLSVVNTTVVKFTITADAASKATDRFKIVFGQFGNPQGVDAITIKASQQNSGVQVDWTSKTETDMVRYEVERSVYGSSFSKVNTATALGNSNAPVSYNWFDTNPNMGTSFYRIKGIDKAGNLRYSDVVRVLFGMGEPAIVVYPNPLQGTTFKIDMYNLVKGTYSLNLYSNDGRLVYTEQLQHDGSQATKTINLKTGIVKGLYQLQFGSDKGFTTMQKIINN